MRPVPSCLFDGSVDAVTVGGHASDRFAEIGSLTKVLTGTALARMAAEALLSLDDPLHHWLPTPRTGITLRHLAEHTSGLPRLPPHLSRADPYASFTPQALRTLLPTLDALTSRPPGTREEYSNLGYAVLGAALEAAAGLPYEDLVRRHVLDPLGVDEVSAHPPADRTTLAPGRFGRPRRPWTMDGAILPAGGLWATPRAVAGLVVALLLEHRPGPPAPSWRRTGSLRWHNGATRHASVFAGALDDGRWVVLHRLNSPPGATDRAAARHLARQHRDGPRQND